VATFLAVVIIGLVVAIFILLAWALHFSGEARTMAFIAVAVMGFATWICFALGFALINYFMPMVMYIRRCGAFAAFREVAGLIWANPGSFLLFALFGLVLLLALIVVSTIVSCATCCIAALPYIGTVIMLPAYVWLRAFGLLFFRQFGPDYDVWKGQPPLPPLAPPLSSTFPA
jgi:hypothetical protein